MENYCQDVKKKIHEFVTSCLKRLGDDVIKDWRVSIQIAANKSEGWRAGSIWQFLVCFFLFEDDGNLSASCIQTHSILNIDNSGNKTCISRVLTGWYWATSASLRAADSPRSQIKPAKSAANKHELRKQLLAVVSLMLDQGPYSQRS